MWALTTEHKSVWLWGAVRAIILCQIEMTAENTLCDMLLTKVTQLFKMRDEVKLC